MSLVSRRLAWEDVCPERRHFDLGLAKGALESVVERALLLHVDEAELEEWIDEELTWHFGIWLAGWRSGPDGGPVQAYDPLFSRSALLQDGQTDPEPTLQRVLAAVIEWQEYLEALDLHFELLPYELNLERAACQLLPMIRAKTGGHKGWPETLMQALQWYLETRGLCDGGSRAALVRAAAEPFGNGPSPSACARLAHAFEAREPGPTSTPLEQWLAVRGVFPRHHWGTLQSVGKLRQDGHLEHIERKERDPLMLQALGLCRGWAEGVEPLTLQVLQQWHSVIAGGEVRGNGGASGLGQFVRLLEEANNTEVSPDWRAATAYLDIRHFHLFSDGNHRLARLALDGILWREGFALNNVAPLLLVARRAHEESQGGIVASQVNALLGLRKKTKVAQPPAG